MAVIVTDEWVGIVGFGSLVRSQGARTSDTAWGADSRAGTAVVALRTRRTLARPQLSPRSASGSFPSLRHFRIGAVRTGPLRG